MFRINPISTKSQRIKHEIAQEIAKNDSAETKVSGCRKRHPDVVKEYPDALKRHPDAFIFQLQNDE